MSLAHNQKGFTLVELMIGMAISLIIMAGVVYVFTQLSSVSLYETRAAKAQAQLRDVLSIIANDVRRAGFQGHKLQMDNIDKDIKINIFSATQLSLESLDTSLTSLGESMTLPMGMSDMPNGTEITVYDHSGTKNCIIYAYNHSATETNSVSAAHVTGFRWVEGENDSEVKRLKSLSGASTLTCSGTADGDWESITSWGDDGNGELEVTGLSFDLPEKLSGSVSGANCTSSDGIDACWRTVTITISGAAKTTDGTSFETSMSRQIKLPNVSFNES